MQKVVQRLEKPAPPRIGFKGKRHQGLCWSSYGAAADLGSALLASQVLLSPPHWAAFALRNVVPPSPGSQTTWPRSFPHQRTELQRERRHDG